MDLGRAGCPLNLGLVPNVLAGLRRINLGTGSREECRLHAAALDHVPVDFQCDMASGCAGYSVPALRTNIFWHPS
jgi:hypothetical protein